MRSGNNLKVYMALLIAMIIWGLSFIWYKQAYVAFRPATVIVLRLFISSPLLLLSAFLLRRLKWPDKKDIKYFLLLAFFEPFLYFIGESYGMLYVSSTLASILIATIPLITPFAGYFFFKERLKINNYFGMLLSFTGVVLVVYVEGKLGEAQGSGILLILIAVLSTVGYTSILKRISEKYNALSILWFQNLIGGIYFLPLFLFTEFKSITWDSLSFSDFMPILYLSIFASSLAFIFFIQGVRTLGMTQAVVFVNFIPIVTAVFAVYLLQERLPWLKIMGIMVTILGLFLTQINGFPIFRKNKKTG